MKHLYKGFIALLFSLFLFTACENEHKESHDCCDDVKDGLFLHIKSGVDNPHEVLMALNMAAMMSEDKPVVIYFDIKGIEVVLKDSPNLTFAHFPESHAQIKKLAEKGVTLMACPGCLKAAGKTVDDLREGVKAADKKKFFNFNKGRIVTLDY